ncbi:MAG: nicotinamide riboside transporter PnuC [Sarcina sp.]
MDLLGLGNLYEDIKGWSAFDYSWAFIAITTMVGLSIYWKDSPIGIISALANIICVLLVAKGKISNYFFGLIGVVLYGYVAFTNKYFGDAMLNFIYYLPMQFIGYKMWLNKSGEQDQFKELSGIEKAKVALFATVVIGIYGLFLQRIGGALPFVDATSTVLSVVAMILMAKGYLDQWLLWIIVNTVSVVMWVVVFTQGGENISTLIMWSVCWLNAVYGYWNWRKMVKNVKN